MILDITFSKKTAMEAGIESSRQVGTTYEPLTNWLREHNIEWEEDG